MDKSVEGNPAAVLAYAFVNGIGLIAWCVLLILKCCNVVNIDWFWVWFPLWAVPVVETIAILLHMIIFIFKDKIKGLK